MKIHSTFITDIICHSHILEQNAFRVLMSEKALSRVLEVKPNSLKIEIVMTEDMKERNTDYYGYAFVVSASFLMALNIASLGHFSWLSGSKLFWHCEHTGPTGNSEQIFFSSKSNPFPNEKRILTEKEVRNSIRITPTSGLK
jgi:hemolysin-activating ACP:hemolysin acyltransferase